MDAQSSGATVVRGDLHDVQLPSLIQVMCLRGKTTGIILERPGERGTVFIRQGEVIDAEAGSSRGEDAVHYLLTWDDGTFRLVDLPTPSEPSVQAPWHRLLLEGMQRIDEDRREGEIEDALVTLLSELEQLHVKLRDLTRRRKPEQTLRVCVELVDRTAGFYATMPRLGSHRLELSTVLQKVAATNPHAARFRVESGRLSIERALSGRPEQPDRAAICSALLDVLEHGLGLAVKRFGSAQLRELWGETCTALVGELRATLAA